MNERKVDNAHLKNKTAGKAGILREGFIKSLPILCSYLFLGMAYGILMEEAGLPWFLSLFTSLTVYTGAFQFVLIGFMSGGASLLTIAVTALLMNSRQTFYAITFLKDFSSMGKRKWFMVHTLTDETYAVNCTLETKGERRYGTMFVVALLSWLYWAGAAALGGIVGQLIPYDTTGIDFCMTALFITIFIEQWEKTKNHRPALAGLGIGILMLCIFGPSTFMLPSLLITSGLLLVIGGKEAA